MPRASFRTRVVINVPQEKVFDYVADLSRHGEWASDPVEIATIKLTPQKIGSCYRSIAQSHGVTFHSELVVSEYNPPARFAFVGQDSTGKVEHLFTFRADGEDTLVERQMRFDVNFMQWLAYLVVLYPVRIPSARRTLLLLKAKLEESDKE
jgi:uncharacterized protein YndB with AHSA1/START domain